MKEARVNKLMVELNRSLTSIPAKYDLDDHTVTDKKYFPLARFRRHLKTKFPESDNVVVSADRMKWSCRLCGAGQDLNDGRAVYHRQNVFKHFRSQDHCALVTSLSATVAAATTKAVTAAVEQHQQTQIATESVAGAVRDDAVISCARKSVSFVAVPVVLQVVARAVMLCRGKDRIPISEIQEIRKVSLEAWCSRIATNADLGQH